MLTWFKEKKPKSLSTWIELLAIAIFGIWVTKPYLNFDPQIWPIGNEFASSVQNSYIWTLLPKCGICMLWNGWLNGGAPAFAELQGSVLHPVTVLTTLIWGVTNGAKVALTIGFIMAGWAQWWIAKTLKLGRTARLWSGAIAIVGGHLSGRVELGIGVLDVSACTLIIAPGLSTVLNGRRRDVVLFGLMVALALLSGGGYQQVGMFLAIIPAFLIFTINSKIKFTPAVKNFAMAAILAVFLSGIFWVPMLHLWPNIYKDTDPQFTTAQPMTYAPLNLVISDRDFQYSQDLYKTPYPSLNSIYIGWIPILLAILAFRAPKTKEEIKVFLFFIISIALVFLTSSAILLKFLASINKDIAGGVQHCSIISALSVPCILALSAWGLDWLIKKAWPQIELKTENVNLKLTAKVLLVIPLIWAIVACYNFGRNWISVEDVSKDLWHIAEQMKTKYTAWVSFPFGEHFWMIPGLDSGLKIGQGIYHWKWKSRDFPPSTLEGTRDPVDQTAPTFQAQIFGINIIEHPDVSYAFILSGDQEIPCNAKSIGGNIDMTCSSSLPGTLVVSENSFSGWTAKIDGKSTHLIPYKYWLAVKAPPGSHTYQFRYRPWDVPLGIALTVIGIFIIIWMLYLKDKKINSESSLLRKVLKFYQKRESEHA
jgi:hypothetical protein